MAKIPRPWGFVLLLITVLIPALVVPSPLRRWEPTRKCTRRSTPLRQRLSASRRGRTPSVELPA